MEIIALASDHRGYAIKVQLLTFLRASGYMPLDLGTNNEDRVDSQDYAVILARALKDGQATRGIILCGSGNGIAMAANRFSHIRAAVVPHVTAARMARLHNNANVISLAADFMGYELMKDCIEVFLKTRFLGGRYAARVEKLTALNTND